MDSLNGGKKADAQAEVREEAITAEREADDFRQAKLLALSKSERDAAPQWGRGKDERCPNCGKFTQRENCFFDLEDTKNEASELLRFCDKSCAKQFHVAHPAEEYFQGRSVGSPAAPEPASSPKHSGKLPHGVSPHGISGKIAAAAASADRARRQHVIGARRFNRETEAAEPAREFHLGYKQIGKLEEFSTAAEADAVCHEWVTLRATSIEDAKSNHEAAFDAWQAEHEPAPAAPQPANAAPAGCEAQPKPWGDLSPLSKRLAAAHQQSAVLDKLLSALKDVREELGRLHLEAPSWKRWEAKADAAIAAAPQPRKATPRAEPAKAAQRSDTAEEILARQDKQDDESFGKAVQPYETGTLGKLEQAQAELERVKQQRDKLLKAAQRVEANSHWCNDVYGYVVSKEAMDMLCLANAEKEAK